MRVEKAKDGSKEGEFRWSRSAKKHVSPRRVEGFLSPPNRSGFSLHPWDVLGTFFIFEKSEKSSEPNLSFSRARSNASLFPALCSPSTTTRHPLRFLYFLQAQPWLLSLPNPKNSPPIFRRTASKDVLSRIPSAPLSLPRIATESSSLGTCGSTSTLPIRSSTG